ncbi:MAG: NitT/TauT family transport system permease protein [Chloroflexota bacterium]|jgi:NitT/TauT family transport system permease protein|nr:NitT/TauT family transport system permease protein [Chloroflexota bacterium]
MSRRAIVGAASVGVVILAWQLMGVFGLLKPPFFVPPSAVLAAGAVELVSPRFWNDVYVSGQELVYGYALAAVTAIPFGLAVGWYVRLGYLFEPLMGFMNALPRIALMPLILLTLGFGLWSIVTVVFLGVFFTVAINTVQGVRVVEPRYLDVARSYRARDLTRFRTVVLPSAIPFVVAGLRLGIGRALIGVVIGELYAANAGLGHMIRAASNSLQTDRLLFATLFLIVVSLVVSEALRSLERRVAPWRAGVSLAAGT